jgi:hypothetical protein
MARVHDLARVPYWLFMALLAGCRFVITWAYCVLFVCCLGAALRVIGETSAPSKLSRILVIALPLVWAFTSGVAWWATFRGSRSHRVWVMTASVAYFLSVGIFLIETRLDFSALGLLWAFLVIGAVGLLTYVPPYRLRLSGNLSSQRGDSAGQGSKGSLKWLLVGCRFVVSWAYCFQAAAALGALGCQIRQSSIRQNAVGMVWLCALAFVSVATWWTTLRKRSSHAAWVIAASLLTILSAVPMLAWRPRLYPSPGMFGLMVVIGVAGLAVYVLPSLIHNSVEIISYKVNRPENELKRLRISF